MSVEKNKILYGCNFNKSNADYLQYIHFGSCKVPCFDCPERDFRIYENGEEVKLPDHFGCDCHYNDIKTKLAGNISNKGICSPDVYLKPYGKLPNYYITKEETCRLGRQPGKNLAYFAPGKMIGGNIFANRKRILPIKEGITWYECDVDYVTGKRNILRLYYSNDGLMFYSEFHDERQVMFIK